MSLHQGLTRQAHQPGQAPGRYPHDPVVIAVAVAIRPAARLRAFVLRGLCSSRGQRGRRSCATAWLAPLLLPGTVRHRPVLSETATGSRELRPDGAGAGELRFTLCRSTLRLTCQVGHQAHRSSGVLGLPGLHLRLAELCDLDEQVHPLSRMSTCAG